MIFLKIRSCSFTEIWEEIKTLCTLLYHHAPSAQSVLKPTCWESVYLTDTNKRFWIQPQCIARTILGVLVEHCLFTWYQSGEWNSLYDTLKNAWHKPVSVLRLVHWTFYDFILLHYKTYNKKIIELLECTPTTGSDIISVNKCINACYCVHEKTLGSHVLMFYKVLSV